MGVSHVSTELSVVICTHDRSHDVAECLQSLLAQAQDAALQVVVIDSASSGAHRERLASIVRNDPSIVLRRLEQPGLSLARNEGARLATGAWIAYLDDDAVPASDWLARAHEIVRSVSPQTAVVGGRIVPRWPGAVPTHVGKRWLMFLSCIEELAQPASGKRPQCYGANLLCRRKTIADVGGFAEDLGRTGSSLLSGEETLFLGAVEARGERVAYDGRLVVEHKIGPERLTSAWIRERAYWGGVTEVVMAEKLGLGLPPHLHPAKLAATIPVLAVLSMIRDRDSDFAIRAWYARGALAAIGEPQQTRALFQRELASPIAGARSALAALRTRAIARSLRARGDTSPSC
jgi:glucosyl-dolichyl phosphate glucuronosyltransferase